MKKLLTLLMVASIFSLVACGPSAEEKEQAEKDAKAMADDLMKGLDNATTDEATDESAEVKDSTATEATDTAAVKEETPETGE